MKIVECCCKKGQTAWWLVYSKEQPVHRLMIGVAGGVKKAEAILERRYRNPKNPEQKPQIEYYAQYLMKIVSAKHYQHFTSLLR